MYLDVGVILILMRMIRQFGRRKVNKEIQRYLKKKEKRTKRDYSFEKQEFSRLISEL
jgi:hypothetical protein